MRVNQNKSDENESIDEGGQVAEIVKGDSKGSPFYPRGLHRWVGGWGGDPVLMHRGSSSSSSSSCCIALILSRSLLSGTCEGPRVYNSGSSGSAWGGAVSLTAASTLS
uniref:Uncharacterized protein n=1 Tax=Magallana gigas TaxID=29159 RepID=K1P9Z5_MAGGI